jgi:hypothetical protein
VLGDGLTHETTSKFSPERVIRCRDRREAPKGPPPVPMSMAASLVFRPCLEADGRVSTAVVEHRCANERTGRDFTAFVCLEAGRVTRVTCRTFVPSL